MGELAGLDVSGEVSGSSRGVVADLGIEQPEPFGFEGGASVLPLGESVEAVGAGVGVGRAGGDGAALVVGAAEGVGGEHGDWGGAARPPVGVADGRRGGSRYWSST